MDLTLLCARLRLKEKVLSIFFTELEYIPRRKTQQQQTRNQTRRWAFKWNEQHSNLHGITTMKKFQRLDFPRTSLLSNVKFMNNQSSYPKNEILEDQKHLQRVASAHILLVWLLVKLGSIVISMVVVKIFQGRCWRLHPRNNVWSTSETLRRKL